MSTERKEASLRVRINHVDYTLVHPGILDNASLPRVPVIRIYGDSSLGQKACLHIHQVYPYFFVEYRGKLHPESVHRYIARLSLSLNHAIAVSMKRNPHSLNSQFIRAIILVKGVHFYGFHDTYSPFLKVHITDPAFVNRAVTILQSGVVMQTHFRVFESHLSYVLQFLCDFGLYGCGWVELDEILQRTKNSVIDVDEEGEEGDALPFPESPYPRQSRMPFEFDAAAHQILNRHSLSARDIHHELRIPAPPLPPEPLVISVRELWEDERRRRAAKGLPATPSIPLDPSESSRDLGAGWVAEARYWEEVRKRIEKERGREAKPRDPSWARWVMSTFESIEALWEPHFRTWKPRKDTGNQAQGRKVEDQQDEELENPYEPVAHSQPSASSSTEESNIEVDEMMLSSQEMRLLTDQETEGWRPPDEEQGTSSEEEDFPPEDEDPSPPQDATPPQEMQDAVQVSDVESLPKTPTKLPRTPTKARVTREDGFQVAWRKLIGRGATRMEAPRLPNMFMTPRKSRVSTPMPAHSTPDMNQEPAPYSALTDSILRNDDNHDSNAVSTELPTRSHLNAGSQRSQRVAYDLIDCSHPALIPDARYSSEGPTPGIPVSPSEVDDMEVERPTKRRKIQQEQQADSTVSNNYPSTRLPPSRPILASQTRRSDGTRTRSVFLSKSQAYSYSRPPPSASTLLSTLDNYGLPAKIYRDPYYSNEADVPEKPREYAGLVYHLKGGEDVANLEEWQCGSSCDYPGLQKSDMPQFDRMGVGGWEYASSPPSRREVEKWLRTTSVGHRSARRGRVSEAAGSSQHNVTKAKKAVNNAADANRRERQNMTILSFEILALSRGDLVPDADVDEIVVAFYSFQGEDEAAAPTTGFIAVEDVQLEPKRLRDVTIDFVPNELELLNRVVDQVSEYDPDILVGWEIQASSWGYLNVRGRAYGLDITELLSRAPARRAGGGNHQWGLRTTSTFSVVGRHVLNLWRIMRSEYTLAIYTFENVAFNVLHKRIPHYGHRVLTSWFRSNVPNHTMQALRHMSNRTLLNLEILDRAEFITKTAEFARIFGVDFFSVISRGSQFKVESFMFRIAKPESFVLISPSKQDVGKQNAAECMPLIMEPLSAFYNSPLVVLDFQSLYPSIMIAYNYCYSTCLGRVVDFKGRNKFGVSELHLRPGLLDTLKDHIHIAPNGMMYVKPEVRKGLLGRMLTELLETRVMVKQAMKSAKDDKILRRVLDARQLALKFIANVTYGYTSATYSGRMPAVEIADSIVQSGRETLEKAIRIIDSTKKWGARVVYGDTDSLFIYLRGKTKEQAFRIGHDIADTITRANPAPVKLKFEKVYLPCVLMAKKRYVGFKYENPDDVEPVFDAKGIETVRRDGIPAQRKMTEDCLRILFQTQDLSKVKEYCWRAWSDVLENRISIQDFIFAKEVKMGTYSEKAPPPPGVTVAARRMMEDEANEPQYGERVRYVIVKGGPHSRLVDRAVAPEELLDQRHKRLDANYYISNVLIPPLERIFNLVGADVRSWYDEMPKAIKVDPIDPLMLSPKKRRDATLNRLKIEEHFQNSDCIVCGASTSAGLCEDCVIDPQPTITSLLSQVRAAERRLKDAHEVCSSCALSPRGEPILCDSLDCSWLFERKSAEEKAEAVAILEDFIEEMEELHV